MSQNIVRLVSRFVRLISRIFCHITRISWSEFGHKRDAIYTTDILRESLFKFKIFWIKMKLRNLVGRRLQFLTKYFLIRLNALWSVWYEKIVPSIFIKFITIILSAFSLIQLILSSVILAIKHFRKKLNRKHSSF